MMKIKEAVEKARTFRRFDEQQSISRETLEELIELARLGGSARNCQPWQYMIVTESSLCEKIFPLTGWAGYLSDWKGPAPGERPTAYILCLLNKNWLKGPEKEAHFDLGISSQNLLLGAIEKNIGGCRIGSFSPKIADLFEMKDNLSLELVIALGVPAEQVVIEEVKDNDVAYWHGEERVHHVPKRALADIIVDLPLK